MTQKAPARTVKTDGLPNSRPKKKLFGADLSVEKCKIRFFGIKISFKWYKFIKLLLSSPLPLRLRWWIKGKLDKYEIYPMWQYEIRYHKFDLNEISELFEIYKLYPKNIMNSIDSIDFIIKNKISVARIGDGEIVNEIVGKRCYFPELKERLIKILMEGSNSKCLVCTNAFFPADQNIKLFLRKVAAFYWIKVITLETFKTLKFTKNGMYGDAYCFLNYFKENDSKDVVEQKKKYIRKIWDKRKILFVVNKNSPVVNDTTEFCDTKEKAYIYGPAAGAFSEYERIMKEIKQYDKDWLIYIELGPCATILAYELSKLGYQALDMGNYYSRIISNNFTDIDAKVI